MADNIAITQGSGTSIAADDISSVWYQRVKLSLGADGTAVDAVAGAGAVGTGVQRTTLASDDPAVASLAVLDDWDESDRAKVNPIAGQAGVAAGAGAVSALTQRVTLASDDPAVAALGGVADAAATQGSTGSISAKLRTVTAQLNTLAGYLDGVEGLLGGTLTVGTHAVTNTALTNFGAGEYETVAASQTTQALGATGATGDFLSGLLIIPATTSPGAVAIKDGANAAITVFAGGADSVSNLVPFFIPLGTISGAGAWQVTTGANVSVFATGNFT